MKNKAEILMSIRPQYVREILNGKKTIEVRKKFPKDYVGWVYIYCTKGKEKLYDDYPNMANGRYKISKVLQSNDYLNGKVVARFWCNKIAELECEFWEEPLFDDDSCYQGIRLIERDLDYPDEEQLWEYHEMVSNEDGYTDEQVYKESKFLQKCCLSLSEIKKYIGIGGENRCFGIHISKIEVFKEPRLLTMFRTTEFSKITYDINGVRFSLFERLRKYSITKAPQSWCYIDE